MINARLQDAVIAVLIGVGFFVAHYFLIGLAAAIAFPDWYRAFAEEYPALSLALFSLVTLVPAIAMASIISAYFLVKFVSSQHFVYGIVSLIVATLLTAALSGPYLSYFEALSVSVIPSHVVDVPRYLAYWCTLPLVASYFRRKTMAA